MELVKYKISVNKAEAGILGYYLKRNVTKTVTWKLGTPSETTYGSVDGLSTRITIFIQKVKSNYSYSFVLNSSTDIAVLFWTDGGSFISKKTWGELTTSFKTPSNASKIAIVLKYKSEASITPSVGYDLFQSSVLNDIYDSNDMTTLYWLSGTVDDSSPYDFYQVPLPLDNRAMCRFYNVCYDTDNDSIITFTLASGIDIAFSQWESPKKKPQSSGWLRSISQFKLSKKYIYFGIVLKNNDDNNPIVPSATNITNLKQTIDSSGGGEEGIQVNYSGECLPFGRSLIIKDYMTISNWKNSQGAAVYDNYLVSLLATDEEPTDQPNGFIHNLSNGALVSNLIFGNTTAGGAVAEYPHANTVNFGHWYGSQRYFPLLYVSQVRPDMGVLGGVLVYNLMYENNTYVPKLLQIIKPDTSDETLMQYWGQYTPNYIIDTDKDEMYVLNYPHETWFDLTGNTYVTKFKLPKISDGEEVTLTSADLLDHFELDKCYGLQMSFYYHGKIYISGGFGGAGAIKNIRVLDLELKLITTEIDLSAVLSEEPQFIGVYRNKFLYYSAGTSGKILEFVF